MAEVTPVPASSVLLLRDAPLRVLMMRRPVGSSFVPDMWVFPGGAVEEIDRTLGSATTLDTMRVAGARETFEETGIWLGDECRRFPRDCTLQQLMREAPLDPERLVWTSHWITPAGIPIRFDAWFFLIKVDSRVVPPVQSGESVEMEWIEPGRALERNRLGDFPMVFPTLKNLEVITSFQTADDLIESRRGADIRAVEPRLVIDGGRKKIVLP